MCRTFANGDGLVRSYKSRTFCHSRVRSVHVVKMAAATRSKKLQFHCVVCSSVCATRSIRCIDCGRWTHIDCVGFHESVLDVRPIDFVCKTCVSGPDGQFAFEKSLIRFVCKVAL